uniref:Uncharacterized protein n=1 Tax=Cacopsylla melanoneura TaxID=428564 RepID=A0A8D9B3S6_9HEMI
MSLTLFPSLFLYNFFFLHPTCFPVLLLSHYTFSFLLCSFSFKRISGCASMYNRKSYHVKGFRMIYYGHVYYKTFFAFEFTKLPLAIRIDIGDCCGKKKEGKIENVTEQIPGQRNEKEQFCAYLL